jgi:hypothetical protein
VDFRQLRFGEEKFLVLDFNPTNPEISIRRSEAVGNPVKETVLCFLWVLWFQKLKL